MGKVIDMGKSAAERAKERWARLDALEERLDALLDEFPHEDTLVAARFLRRAIEMVLRAIDDDPETNLPPDTTGLVRCSARTRAGRDGRLVWCPHCGRVARLYNFGFCESECMGCYTSVPRDEWWTTPVK